MTAANTVRNSNIVKPFSPPPHKNGKTIKLDLACGNNKQKGFKGIDLIKEGTQADIQHDLLIFPWPLEKESVEEIFCCHYFEHVPGMIRGKFMDEIWRILIPGGFARFITPYATSNRSIQDFTHQWPPICTETYIYFTREWRKMNNIEHGPYDLKCDFKIEKADPMISEEYKGKSQEATLYAATHYWNVVQDLHVILRKSNNG